MKKLFFSTLVLFSFFYANAQVFDWSLDGYVSWSGGGTYANIDNSGIDLEVNGLDDDFTWDFQSTNWADTSMHSFLQTGTNNGASQSIQHTYTFNFSEKVNITFYVGEINFGATWHDLLLFSGDPVFLEANSAVELLADNVVEPLGDGFGWIKVAYLDILSFEIRHGLGEGINPGLIYLSPIIIESSPTALNDEEMQKLISIFPNPSEGSIVVESDQMIDQIMIYDVAGKELLRSRYHQNRCLINIESFPSGMFLVKVEANGQSIMKKLIKR